MTDAVDDLPQELQVTETEVVFRGRVWDVVRDTVDYPGASDGTIVREYVKHPGAVGIVAVDDRGRVPLIQQYRHPIRHRDWEVPAGLLDVPDEDPLDAAQRELAEEADLLAEHWQPLLSIFPTPGGNDEVIQLFLAQGLTAADGEFAREDEEADIRIEWVQLGAVVDGIIAGRIHNGPLIAGVFAAIEVLRRQGRSGG